MLNEARLRVRWFDKNATFNDILQSIVLWVGKVGTKSSLS